MDDRPRYPSYDVLAKRNTLSWDAATRRVIAARLATPNIARYLTESEWRVADALCRRIVPQSDNADEVSLVALLDAKLLADHGAGFRQAGMPYMREAWRKALAAIESEAQALHHGQGFADISHPAQDALLSAMQEGSLSGPAWADLDAKTFFERRILVDVPPLYYGHPKAWSEIGFGGPASPRGYVRLDGNRLDPWEAVEASVGPAAQAERKDGDVV